MHTGIQRIHILDGVSSNHQLLQRCFNQTYGEDGWCGTCSEVARQRWTGEKREKNGLKSSLSQGGDQAWGARILWPRRRQRQGRGHRGANGQELGILQQTLRREKLLDQCATGFETVGILITLFLLRKGCLQEVKLSLVPKARCLEYGSSMNIAPSREICAGRRVELRKQEYLAEPDKNQTQSGSKLTFLLQKRAFEARNGGGSGEVRYLVGKKGAAAQVQFGLVE